MKNLFKNIALALVIGAAVGIAIAAIAPTLGTIAGVADVGGMGNPAFMAMFAGAWGALGAAVTPAVTSIAKNMFGKKDMGGVAHDVEATSPVHTITQDSPELEAGRKYQDYLAAEEKLAAQGARR